MSRSNHPDYALHYFFVKQKLSIIRLLSFKKQLKKITVIPHALLMGTLQTSAETLVF